MMRSSMTIPTINPTLVAVATSPGPTAGQAANARKVNAAAYASAMREAKAPELPAKTAERNGPAREAPFGAERPRYQRPGALLDIRV